ncbi:MAG: sulfatase-like hydrolase/transferase [Oscillospiraceae bacterium]|nr:sulfatase-like hydrolase/transferase [Oscillospiraceae bacterium]
MAKKPNILFFGIDSLRRDRMSLYGYDRLTTPHIDKYVEGGTVFTQCISPSIPTTSGYGSMFTGRDCFGTNIVALRHKGEYAPGVPTLAEILGKEGYNTTCVGFKGNAASRGFNNYLEFEGWGSYASGRSHKAENLNAVAVPELHRLASEDKPFFLFLRHMDPHAPYLPPAPYERMFYAGDEYDKNNRSLDATYAFKPFCDFFYSWFPPGCTDAEYIKAQYDGEIAYMDACIQTLLTELATLGLEKDTLVVFTSDHGETLDLHDCHFDHHGLYECTLGVPLAFRLPGAVPQGKRIDDIVQIKDVTPTVLDILSIGGGGLEFEGRSLLGRMNGDRFQQEPEMYITECTWMRKHGWRTPHYKLIRALEPDFHSKPPVELYDLVADPDELCDIAPDNPAIVDVLTARMEAHIKKREAETGRQNPMYTNLNWHGIEGKGPFASSEEAYNTLHIGDVEAARRLQALLAEKERAEKEEKSNG